MICRRCKHEMPDGIRYCGHCSYRMNRVEYFFAWSFDKKRLPFTLLVIALIIGLIVGGIILSRIPPVSIDPDMGWYIPGDDNIVYDDEEESYGYVNNMILVFFRKDTPEDRILEIVKDIDGEVVGFMPGVNQYQIQVNGRTAEELEQLRAELMQLDEVKNAIIDYVATIESTYIPSDPWNDPSNTGFNSTWDESVPNGTNWWAEATRLPAAWNYNDQLSTIKVGVVDNGYDLTHEDLRMTVLNEALNNPEDHGTHVAGIIGAIHGNNLGIAGVLDKVELYCVDCYATEAQRSNKVAISSLLAGIDLCIYNGCKVVNMSSGLMYEYSSSYEKTAVEAINYLVMMLDAYEGDFIVVQSAGNGDTNQNGVTAREHNGYFASITEDLVASVLENMKADGVKLDNVITVEDVMSSIMVIAAVDYPSATTADRMATFSNYGETITVASPGVWILSTVPTGNTYKYLNGTSMAAPLAAGITAMVWSVDQEMTAAEVKDIVVSTAVQPVYPSQVADSGTYYLIDACAAVEKALNILAEKDNPIDESTEAPTEEPTDPTESEDPSRDLTDYTLLAHFDEDLNGEAYFTYDLSYDAMGSLAGAVIHDTQKDETIELTVENQYDADGRLLSCKETYSQDGTPVMSAVSFFEYNTFGQVNRVLYESTTEEGYVLDYIYNLEGELLRCEYLYTDGTNAIYNCEEYDGSFLMRFDSGSYADQSDVLVFRDASGIGCLLLDVTVAPVTEDGRVVSAEFETEDDKLTYTFRYLESDTPIAELDFDRAGQVYDLNSGLGGYTDFYSDDSQIAMVDDNGMVTVCGAGVTKIHAKLDGKKVSWLIRVNTVPFTDEEFATAISQLNIIAAYRDTERYSVNNSTMMMDLLSKNLGVAEGETVKIIKDKAIYRVINGGDYMQISADYYVKEKLVLEDAMYVLDEASDRNNDYLYSAFVPDEREAEVRLMKYYDDYYFCYPIRDGSEDYDFLFFLAEETEGFDFRIIRVVWPAGSK